MFLNAFPRPWTYERGALADHTIWFYLSFPTRPFNIVPIWARNIQAGRLPVFSDCHSGLIDYGCYTFNLIQATGMLNFSSLRYWILEKFPNFNVACFELRYSLRNKPQERRSQLLLGGSLTSLICIVNCSAHFQLQENCVSVR